ncbi:nucleoside deaminase [Fulvivirga sp. M361]|uniref:nucleoside deaminase n=1 Tax=Fulvivirga sp. M361 TaxID=2594266 RepID=UPI00117A115A|nr:nucleoside deaminase [Fulvivirga sp. M361]TRX62739.1 nucleoside deaminase [Fulvivirga sp. M361]
MLSKEPNVLIHENYMQYCLELAKKALNNRDPPLGSILVYQNNIIGEGIESGKSTGDITNHAEILSVRDAISKGNREELKNATMYSTHEPCIMCSYLIRHHKIPVLVFGISVDHIGGSTSEFDLLGNENIPKWGSKPHIIGGILSEACQELNRLFLDSL